MEVKELLRSFSDIMGIPGYEHYGADELKNMVSEYFDEYVHDFVGNHVFIRHSKRENAPKFMIDAHFDEIGAIVTEISPDGFLSFCSIGGLDRRTLPACEMTIYGKQRIYGVVCATPPHLIKGDAKKLPQIQDFRIDTGYSKAQLDKMGISIGTAVGFCTSFLEMENGYLAGKAFDNRSCAAAAIYAAATVDIDCLECDVYVCLSAKEETGMNGAHLHAFKIKPNFAVVTDVNLATVPDTAAHKTVKCGKGVAISLSAITDRAMTNRIINIAKDNEIEYQTVVEARGTGTNADSLVLVECGIPTAVVSIPLKNMHTYSEVLKLSDMEATAKLLSALMTNADFCGSFKSENV